MSSPQLCCQYFLNHDLELSQIELQVKDLIKAGYQCIYAHARLGLFTPYFGRHWWDAIRLIASLCAEHGVGFGIWDEDNYPSPVAGNRLVWDRPELVARHLQFTVAEEQLQAGQQYRLELKPEALLGAFALDEKNRLFDLSEFCGTAATRWQERHLNYTAYTNLAKMPAHHWRAKCNDRRYYLQWQAPEEGRYRFAALQVHHAFDRLHNSDLMNPETIRLFLESTHLRYKQELGEELFNQTVVASFMDEPAVSGFFPWTGNFAAEFASEHGYDLLEQLAHLVWNIDDSSFIVRRDYRMTIHRLLCQNYLAQTQEYCHKLNIQSIGHLTRMEYLSFVDKVWPNQLRACRYLDIPCADPLGAIVALPDSCGNHCALKVAVSAKRIFGKKHAGSDCLAVIGNHTPLRDLKYIFDYHLVMGITFFNVHGLSYSLDGARKDEVPPSLFYQHSQWSEMPALLSEIKQKIELLSGGEDLREIAVLYP
ncbi:MAG: glycosyl hydrolase, partial [Lentisphaeria bacterium]